MNSTGAASRPPDLVIFDCDGVLIDSEIVVAKTHASSLTGAGIVITEEELLRRFVGISDADMYRALEQETGIRLPADHDELTRLAVSELFEKELQPIPASMNCSQISPCRSAWRPAARPQDLSSACRWLSCMITSRPTSSVQRWSPMASLHLTCSFMRLKGWALPRKPAWSKKTVWGWKAAVAAHMPVIGFTGASHCQAGHAEALMSCGAMAVAKSAPELEAIIARTSRHTSR